MKITYLGHSCLLIETNNSKIVVDPFISGNPLAKNIDVDKLSVDYILLTHEHQYNIIVTPHIGGMTYQGQERAYNYAIDKIKI